MCSNESEAVKSRMKIGWLWKILKVKEFLRTVLSGPGRKNRRRMCLNSVAILLTLIFLVEIYNVYRSQEILMRETIFVVLGETRSTSEQVRPFEDTTIIQPSHNCQFLGKNTRGIILVPSHPENRVHRELIRLTWGSNRYEVGMMLFFLTGRPTNGDWANLQTEAKIHGDLIAEDLEENYYALTTKSLRILKWFTHNCPRSKYLIKADDDVFLNLPLFAKYLQTLGPDFQLGGRVLEGRTPNLKNPFSKWYTPGEMWPEGTVAPTYLGGPCYVIKGEWVPKILEASYTIPLYHLEDVFVTGMVASQKLGLKLEEFPGTQDPKYPWWSYWAQKLYTDPSQLITSFHTDGHLILTKRLFEDFEIARALKFMGTT